MLDYTAETANGLRDYRRPSGKPKARTLPVLPSQAKGEEEECLRRPGEALPLLDLSAGGLSPPDPLPGLWTKARA